MARMRKFRLIPQKPVELGKELTEELSAWAAGPGKNGIQRTQSKKHSRKENSHVMKMIQLA